MSPTIAPLTDLAAFHVVAVNDRVFYFTTHDTSQLPAQISGVLHVSIHALAVSRVVDVCSIACDEQDEQAGFVVVVHSAVMEVEAADLLEVCRGEFDIGRSPIRPDADAAEQTSFKGILNSIPCPMNLVRRPLGSSQSRCICARTQSWGCTTTDCPAFVRAHRFLVDDAGGGFLHWKF
jgi:hypothetical protein